MESLKGKDGCEKHHPQRPELLEQTDNEVRFEIVTSIVQDDNIKITLGRGVKSHRCWSRTVRCGFHNEYEEQPLIPASFAALPLFMKQKRAFLPLRSGAMC
jgi:hypothetical protein